MLIILLIFALICTLRGIPLPSSPEAPDSFTVLDIRDSQVRFGQRGVNDILISCFATIFACTWSAIHPNIPAPMDSAWKCFKRNVTIMIYALVAPEVIINWALKQRMGARKIVEDYNEAINVSPKRSSETQTHHKGWFRAFFGAIKGLFQDSPLPPVLMEGEGPRWTLTHGFFLQMGGFMLCENGQPVQILTAWSQRGDEKTTIIRNIQKGIIDPPRITEEVIKDRSKGDAISKTLIVFQTTWFIVQCIARWSQRLPVIELEIVTLGFAMLNIITYALWWNKPQNVAQPVFLEIKKPQGSDGIPGESSPTSDSGSPTDKESNLLLHHSIPGKVAWLRRKFRQELEEHGYSPILLWRIPHQVLGAVLRPICKMYGSTAFIKTRVGMFYSCNPNEFNATYASAAIGVLFGAVHLIPSWFLTFSSRQQLWLWRVSAIIITVEPVLMGLTGYFNYLGRMVLMDVFRKSTLTGLPFYIISRIMLLILSLTSLHFLPPAALKTIEWTNFIPHL